MPYNPFRADDRYSARYCTPQYPHPYRAMIRSYRDNQTQRFAEGATIAKFQPFRRQAEKRRICFEWPDRADGPENVQIVDYH